MSVTTIENFAALLRFKKASELTTIVFGAFNDPKQKEFLGAVGQLARITAAATEASEGGSGGVTAKTAFGCIDVDESSENICEPFKIRAMPTVIIFRDAKESARVEGASVEELRQTMAAHMPVPGGETSSSSVAKKIAGPEDAVAAQREEFRVVNAYFGDINSGNVADVTDRVRELIRMKKFISVDQDELGVKGSYENKNSDVTNNLRIVIDRFGSGKTFTVEEGKKWFTSQAAFCFAGHGEIEQLENEDELFGADNKLAQLPQIEKPPRSCGG